MSLEEKIGVVYNAASSSRMSARIDPFVNVDITEEERSRASEYCGGRALHVGGIGFIAPERIMSHYCPECDKEFDGAPEISVFIGDSLGLGEWKGTKEIGSVIGKCNECEGYIIGMCPVYDNQDIDVKYVKKDDLGLLIKPTESDIEKRLEEHKKEADERGEITHSELKITRTLAEVIGYAVEDKIKELEDFAKERDLEMYMDKLPEHIDQMYDHFNEWVFKDMRCLFDDEYGIYPTHEHFYENMKELIEKMHQIPMPENDKTKSRIIEMIHHYREDFLAEQLRRAEKAKEEGEKWAKEVRQRIDLLPDLECDVAE